MWKFVLKEIMLRRNFHLLASFLGTVTRRVRGNEPTNKIDKQRMNFSLLLLSTVLLCLIKQQHQQPPPPPPPPPP